MVWCLHGIQTSRKEDFWLWSCSSQRRAVVTLRNGDLLRLFLKIRSTRSTTSKAVSRKVGSQAEFYDGLLKIYQREEMMYEKLLPLLAAKQKERGKVDEPQVLDLFPTFYGSGSVEGDLYLVFQVIPPHLRLNWANELKDIMTGTGLRVTEKDEFHTVEQVGSPISYLEIFTYRLDSGALRLCKWSKLYCVLWSNVTLETGIMYKSLKSEQSCLVCRSIVKRHTYDVDSSVNELPTDLIQLYNVYNKSCEWYTSKGEPESFQFGQLPCSLAQLWSWRQVSELCLQSVFLSLREILTEFPLLEDSLFHPGNKDVINSFFAGEMKV